MRLRALNNGSNNNRGGMREREKERNKRQAYGRLYDIDGNYTF
jgi:hypothetical protein